MHLLVFYPLLNWKMHGETMKKCIYTFRCCLSYCKREYGHFFTSQLSMFLMYWNINITDDIIIEKKKRAKKVYSIHYCSSNLKHCTTYCEFQSMGTVVIFLMCHLIFWIANLVHNMTLLALSCAKLLLAGVDDVLVIANWTPWSFLCTLFCHIGHTEKKVHKSPKRTQNSDYILHYTTYKRNSSSTS